MIFGDEVRFTNKTLSPCGDGLAATVAHVQTDAHLGPGAYFTAQNENIRSGWRRKSFSKRQPMAPASRDVDRSHHYVAGVLLSSGYAVPGSPNAQPTPGPGHYLSPQPFLSPRKSPRKAQGGQLDASLNSIRPQSAGSVSGISRRGSVATLGSPRITTPRSIMRDGVIFHSSNRVQDSSIGPGYYAPVSSSFVVKSFNARVKNSIKKSAAQASSPSAAGSPSSRSPATLTVFPFDAY